MCPKPTYYYWSIWLAFKMLFFLLIRYITCRKGAGEIEEKRIILKNLKLMLAFLCQIPAEISKSNGNNLLVDDKSKYKSMWIRAYSSLWMLASVSLIIYLGHLYIWAMVVVIQIFMASELFNLLRRATQDKRLPKFKFLNW